MVGATFVVERILDELESGQPDRPERDMIRPTGAGECDVIGAKISERREDGCEERAGSGIALQVDSADPATAVVEIEIRRESNGKSSTR